MPQHQSEDDTPEPRPQVPHSPPNTLIDSDQAKAQIQIATEWLEAKRMAIEARRELTQNKAQLARWANDLIGQAMAGDFPELAEAKNDAQRQVIIDNQMQIEWEANTLKTQNREMEATIQFQEALADYYHYCLTISLHEVRLRAAIEGTKNE